MDGLRKRNTKKLRKMELKSAFYLKKSYLYLGHLWRIPLKLKILQIEKIVLLQQIQTL